MGQFLAVEASLQFAARKLQSCPPMQLGSLPFRGYKKDPHPCKDRSKGGAWKEVSGFG